MERSLVTLDPCSLIRSCRLSLLQQRAIDRLNADYIMAELNATAKYQWNQVLQDGEQPPPEIQGDVFDRQRVMKDFNQKLLEEQRAFVLGVGGIGSSVAMCLVRLGIQTIYLLDRDHVDASNLNRQILFSVSDVGRSKVEAGAERLKELHNLRTNIVQYHLDAVKHWSKVVEIARTSTVIFNNIDYGAVFDYAVNSLCKSLGIIYVDGSTYANSIDIHLYSGQIIDSCWACSNNTRDSFHFPDTDLSKIDDLATFLKGQCCISGDISEQILNDGQNETIDKHSLMELYEKKVLRLLLPDQIQKHSSIEFIPKDRSFPTRTVGSWVCVCVSGSCLIVNTWIKYLMKVKSSSDQETNKAFHNWIQVNLSMFNGGLETVGFPTEQDPQCPVCSNIRASADEKQIG